MNSHRYNHSKSLKLLSLICSIVIVMGGFFGFNTYNNRTSNAIITSTNTPDNTALTVQFLDVGQGNCVVAESDGHFILIDGGDREHSSFVVSYLTQLGITSFDYVIISHYDADHLNGVIGVMHQFNINNIIAPNYIATTKTYNSYQSLLSDNSYVPIYPSVGESYYFGNAAFQIVCPDNYNYEDENNNSIGIRLTDSYHSFLILGDAESESETAMLSSKISLQSDVYMVSHHGSTSSTSERFLNVVHPSFAVISVGADNDYGHPKEAIIDRLNAANISILRTDKNGTIIAYSGQDFLSWNIEKDEN